MTKEIDLGNWLQFAKNKKQTNFQFHLEYILNIQITHLLNFRKQL